MTERYSRNYLYISPGEQKKIMNTTLLFGGAGIGSIIAESALRMGFRNMIIYDGDDVELSNLNRQNYVEEDINRTKVESIQRRLISIDPQANISYKKEYLTANNIPHYIKKADIAINAIDYTSDAPFLFDSVCMDEYIPVIHPFNFGWAGCAYVVLPNGMQFSNIKKADEPFEITLANHTLTWLKNRNGCTYQWLYNCIADYKKYSQYPPPQLSVGSWITAGLVTSILFNLANQLEIKIFPEPYFLSARE